MYHERNDSNLITQILIYTSMKTLVMVDINRPIKSKCEIKDLNKEFLLKVKLIKFDQPLDFTGVY